jgi:purine nucleosidase
MPRVLLDVDPGCDDALALLVAAGHPDVTLDAVTTVAGNAPLPDTTRNARGVLELADKSVPVTPGCAGPLLDALHTAEHVHGPGGLRGDLPDLTAATESEHAHAVDALRAHADSVDAVLGVGPATNLTVGLSVAPDLPDRTDVHLMGGAVERAGNRTPVAEANFRNDPEAAARVVHDAEPTVVPLNVTEQATIGIADLPLAALDDDLATAIRAWLDYPDTTADRDGERNAIHDAVVVADLVAPVLEYETYPATVATEGAARGALLVDSRAVKQEGYDVDFQGTIQVARAIDVEQFRDTVAAGLRALA